MKTKKDRNYSFTHVSERLHERFNGLSMTIEMFDVLSEKFRTDKSNMILVENSDQEIHQIQYKGMKLTFAYSIKRGCITTVMKW